MELVSGIKGGFVDFEILVFGEGKRTRRLQGLTPNCLEFALKVMHRSWGQAVAYYYICIYIFGFRFNYESVWGPRDEI